MLGQDFVTAKTAKTVKPLPSRNSLRRIQHGAIEKTWWDDFETRSDPWLISIVSKVQYFRIQQKY